MNSGSYLKLTHLELWTHIFHIKGSSPTPHFNFTHTQSNSLTKYSKLQFSEHSSKDVPRPLKQTTQLTQKDPHLKPESTCG